ncbi:Pentatricopeptide repeat-containing protein [Actinidia chinensis var. chinensis]|uniref:Pentatricopeptide repeat-containing protein n=1 Tax=Actinidia chinensis var. chinensis TaxID=1590841 RepID=A0A2R6QRA6_ACTCC|nr:Pentatricopeptide repeat-containing protein [Actinidia chinensis var. chinensis]
MLAFDQPKPTLNHHVLAILERCNHINHLKQLQAFLIALGHGHTQFFAFKLVRFCTLALVNLPYARSIFDHLTSPNVFLYTAMVTAYSSRSDHKSALLLYRDMVRRKSPRPNHFIFPHVLKSCPEVLGSRGTELVHTQIVKSGFAQYPVVQTALLDSYSRFCSDLGTARKVFDEMSERNVVSWTAMVSGYARLGKMGSAVLMFEEMPERDVPAWNAVIAGCTQNGLFSESISLFRRMVTMEEDNRPNQVTVVCSLSACGHTGMLQLGRCIHGYIYRYGLGSDSFISNALVDMYGKCGNLKEARRVFDKTSKRSLTSWNSMINCFALHGQSEGAIRVFEEMMECVDDVIPDGVTFVGLLNACTHGGLVEQGQFYFESMIRDYRIEPQIEHYGCLIDLLGRAGRFEEAMGVVRGMRMPPDEVVWGSLLNGCKIHGRIDLAEFAVKKLVEIDPKNGGYGAMLANVYVESGKWDEVRTVRQMLKEQNAYKTPGCSWIEVDNRVNQFYSVDTTHPRTEEIYTILDCLLGFS